MERSARDLPARPGRLRTRFELSGSRLTVQYRRSDATGCFLLLWLVGWTVGCVFLLRLVMAEPKLSHVLFAIPFWASWIFVSCLVLNSFFRKECLELGPEGIQFVCRVIVPIHRRTIPLDEIQGFGSYSTVTDSESNTRQWGLTVRTDGHELRFGQALPDEERVWLIDQLQTHLSRLDPERQRPRTVARPTADPEPFEDKEDKERVRLSERRSGERLTMATTPLTPPSDSRWVRLDDFHQLTFVTRGRFGCGAIGVLLFLNAFWNGIVSVFLMQLFGGDMLRGGEWWGMFVFLIPFVVIGLIMFAGLLAALIEPFRRTRWSFAYGGAQWQMTWFGIGLPRSYPVDQLDRIELWTASQARSAFFSVEQDPQPIAPEYRLVFIDRQDVQRFTVDGLTPGEARWMADVILREARRWFR